MKNTVKPVRYNFPDELHHSIKIASVEQGKTMEALIIAILQKKFPPVKKVS